MRGNTFNSPSDFFACMLGYAANSLFTITPGAQISNTCFTKPPSQVCFALYGLRNTRKRNTTGIPGPAQISNLSRKPDSTRLTPSDPRWGLVPRLTHLLSCQISKAKLRTVAEQVSGFRSYLCNDHTTQLNHNLDTGFSFYSKFVLHMHAKRHSR